MRFGYHGKILKVNLTETSIQYDTPPDTFYRRFTGGSILAAATLLQDTAPGLDAFDPQNRLMFFPGILSGYDAPGLARFVICGKSPVTDGFAEARCEGPFAAALKKSGFDGLVIYGTSVHPVILVIEDGKPRLEDASALWGKTVSQCDEAIQQRYPGAHTAIIGPAGENRVRFANVVCDRCHQASRVGIGAIMGSKKIKAVVLVGGQLPPAADPNRIRQIGEWYAEAMKKNVLSMWQHDRPGFGVWIHTHGIDAALCVNNFQTSLCDYTDDFAPEKFAPYYQKESNCPSCPNNCIKCYATNPENAGSGGLHQEAIGALGPNIGNSSVAKIIDANTRCNELGMDPNSLGFTISFAQECVQKGLLDPGDLNMTFSSQVDLDHLIERIAYRQGLGDTLAEGAWRAAKIVGSGAETCAMTVKKNELTATECRSQTNLALGYATAACGPRYDICEHDWDFDVKVGWSHTLDLSRTIGIQERIPMEYLGLDKVRNYKALNTLWSAVDALGLCVFATAPTRIYSLEKMADLFAAITGFEVSSHEIMRLGEMKNNISRLYNIREGIGPECDTLPDRFFEREIDAGNLAGNKLDRESFHACVAFYYDMMGWDERGIPKKSTLYDLGLNALPIQNLIDSVCK